MVGIGEAKLVVGGVEGGTDGGGQKAESKLVVVLLVFKSTIKWGRHGRGSY